MLAASSSTGNPANKTEKGTEDADELFEGELLAEELENELSTRDGGIMEVGGCGSGLHNTATEAE
jgi:hypothetical protein